MTMIDKTGMPDAASFHFEEAASGQLLGGMMKFRYAPDSPSSSELAVIAKREKGGQYLFGLADLDHGIDEKADGSFNARLLNVDKAQEMLGLSSDIPTKDGLFFGPFNYNQANTFLSAVQSRACAQHFTSLRNAAQSSLITSLSENHKRPDFQP